MAVIVGIDEAGYGPVLGPLVVTGVAFRLPDASANADFWDLLKRCVTRRSSAGDPRLPIRDSKKLYSSRAGLRALERSALVMLRTCDRRPATFRLLLDLLSPHLGDALTDYPWYREFDTDLPAHCSETDVATRANAVRREMTAKRMTLTGVFSEPLLAGHFNRLADRVRNKATVSLGCVFRIIRRVFDRAVGERVWVFVDRQGGRRRYREPLMESFPGYELRIVEESSERSAYELSRQAERRAVEFVTQGEDHHLAVALAGIFSKYIRELFMIAFNDYWRRHVTGLRPTAGYYTDAQRFLQDIAGAADALHLNRTLLVRSR